MLTAEFYLTKKAVQDLNGIWEYTFDHWSEKQADKYYTMLLDTCRSIASSPNLGKNYDIIYPGLRGLKSGRHLIFYREISTSKIEITRILHGRMDIKNRLSD